MKTLSFRHLLCSACFVVSTLTTLSAQGLYTLTDLGFLGGNQTFVNGIDSAGRVGGSSKVPATIPNGNSTDHAFLYYNGMMNDLGTLGGSTSFGHGSNASGQAVGYSFRVADQGFHAFRTQALSAINPVTDDLGTLGGPNSTGLGINNSGQVTGQSDSNNGRPHAYRTAPNAVITAADDLGTLGGLDSIGRAINNLGQVTGGADLPNFFQHAFLSSGNGEALVLTDLGTLANGVAGAQSEGFALNDLGEVVGRSSTTDLSVVAPFLFRNGQMINLGTLGGTYGTGFGINGAGEVVGSSELADRTSHAFLYRNGSLMDLNNLVDSSGAGWLLGAAIGINDAGLIVGIGMFNGNSRGYLLTPSTVPEPATWWLLSIAGLTIVTWRYSLRKS